VNELRNPSQTRVDAVSFWSIFTAGVVYGTVALAGFYTYGQDVDSNILITYPREFHSILTDR
jgi:amino acid permease